SFPTMSGCSPSCCNMTWSGSRPKPMTAISSATSSPSTTGRAAGTSRRPIVSSCSRAGAARPGSAASRSASTPLSFSNWRKGRSEIPEYSDLEQAVGAAAGRINGKYGEVAWTPIRYLNRAYSRSGLAGLYRSARAALVTPLRDGMNLVAKEYVAAQDPNDPGVLVLSEFAGAAADLKASLIVNPNDPESVATAIHRALMMPLNERKERHRELMKAVARTDISRWGERFISLLRKNPAATV